MIVVKGAVTAPFARTANFAAERRMPAGLVATGIRVVSTLVAVAVMYRPSGTEVIRVVLNLALPLALVVTSVKPRNVCPSPKPELLTV